MIGKYCAYFLSILFSVSRKLRVAITDVRIIIIIFEIKFNGKYFSIPDKLKNSIFNIFVKKILNIGSESVKDIRSIAI